MNKKPFPISTNSVNFSIIIPNYNGARFIPDCLNSLSAAIKNCLDSEFELIFVDNGSVDDSVKIAKDITQNISILNTRYLILDKNYGFAGGVNQGINQAKHPWVVVLNNDLTMEPDWFQLIKTAIKNNNDPKIITFFGTVLNIDGTKFESQGLDFKIKGKCLNISNSKTFNKSKIIDLKPSTVWGASASLIVYKKDIIQKIGMFDTDFFAYEEDVDLSIRLNNLGYKTLYIPAAISYHLGGGTSNRMGNFRNRMDAKNWIFLIIKNYSTKDIFSNFFSIKIERFRNLSGLIKTTIKKYRFLSIFYLPYDLIKTYGEVIIKLPKMIKKRHQIQKMLKSSNY